MRICTILLDLHVTQPFFFPSLPPSFLFPKEEIHFPAVVCIKLFFCLVVAVCALVMLCLHTDTLLILYHPYTYICTYISVLVRYY